jgi:hypothetical protein
VIFGCTDDNRGRMVLSRLARWYLIPVIDMGVKLTSVEGTLRAIEGRITWVSHETGCLNCRGRIDLTALHSESLEAGERTRRVEESYAAEIPDREPAVVTYTTGVASLAVHELVSRLFNLDAAVPSSELLIRFLDRSIRRNTRTGAPGHWCTDQATLAAGDADPFLGTLWTS